jgi:CxxC-x17-CxxC domain-containing protein
MTRKFSSSLACRRDKVDHSFCLFMAEFVDIAASEYSSFGEMRSSATNENHRFDVFRTRHTLESWTKGTKMAGDQELTCSDCGQSFTFSGEDQAYFNERGYSTPKRCKTCRQAKKQEQPGGGYQRSESRNTSVICAGCGQQTTVPFEPRGDRPVYCQNCFQARRRADSGGGGRRSFGRGR